MQFLFPNVLWGLIAAIGIPLIIHLFNFRRTKKIYFSNVNLLKSIETQTSSIRKIKNWLIMAARILFLSCLVLAFAQPTFYKNNKEVHSIQQGINGIYLDNSLSMQNVVDGKRYIDLAIIKIDELLSIFNKSPNVQLSTNDFDGQDNFILNASKIKDKLTTVDFSESPRTLESVYKRQKAIANKYNQGASNQLFWFSDFQKSTSGDIKNLKIDSNDFVHLIPIYGKTNHNVFVDSVWLNSPMIREMQNNQLEVKIFNSGNNNVEHLPIKLYIDGNQASTASVDIKANNFAKAAFSFTIKNRGLHKAKISFDDQPISFDNEYFLILNASPSLRVLQLFGQQTAPNYIAKMYSNDSLFQFSSFPITNVDPQQIANADFIVLDAVARIEGEVKNKLMGFLKAGGSLTIIPSEHADIASYQAFLGQYGIQNLSANAAANTESIELREPDKASPFYADVFEKVGFNNVVSLPKQLPILKWGGAVDRILNFKNGLNFLSKTRVGSGTLYILASPLNKAFGNFAEHAYFVPTFFKMAALSSKSDRLAHSFREATLSFTLPDAPKNASYKLKSGKFEIIPIQKIEGKNLYLELPKSSELTEGQILSSGYYDLIINNKVVKTLAINHDNNESKMEVYGPPELKEMVASNKQIQVYDSVKDGAFIEAFKNNQEGFSLWKYLIWAALFFLLTEILLVRFMKS